MCGFKSVRIANVCALVTKFVCTNQYTNTIVYMCINAKDNSYLGVFQGMYSRQFTQVTLSVWGDEGEGVELRRSTSDGSEES